MESSRLKLCSETHRAVWSSDSKVFEKSSRILDRSAMLSQILYSVARRIPSEKKVVGGGRADALSSATSFSRKVVFAIFSPGAVS